MEEIEKTEYPKLISKQKFLSGIKCDILFWNSLFGEESQSFSTKNESNYIRNNIQTETFIEIIKSFFKNHYEIPFAGSIQKAKLETEKSISAQEVLLNGIFIKNSLFAKTDVLKKNEDGSWNLYEIKHSVSIKKDYYAGSFFQKKVLELSGLVIQKCFIIQPNDKYILDGEFDIEKFLLFTDITEKVNGGKKLFNERLEKLVQILETKTRPILNTESSCSSAKICTLKTCWKQPENMDIFQLRDGKELSNELYSKGIYYIKDIPLNIELTENQKIQISSSISQKEFINELKLGEFLNQLIYPLYFLDFETINPSTPIFQKTTPFLHVPFLYSLQIQKEETSNLETYSYIDNNSVDPREKILEDLSSLISANGIIVCFNDSFEKRCLREAVLLFPKYKPWLDSILDNFVDLSIVFRNFYYYHPNQKGSASLKSVLPAITDWNHKDLEISNGNLANLEFLKIKTNKIAESEVENLKEKLIEYCHLDTFALYKIIQILKLKA